MGRPGKGRGCRSSSAASLSGAVRPFQPAPRTSQKPEKEALVCAACPAEHQQEVSKLCRQHKISKVFQNNEDSTSKWCVAQWAFGVQMAVVALVEERGAARARLICIEGGSADIAADQMVAQQNLVTAIRKSLGQDGFPIRIEWTPLGDFWKEFGNPGVACPRNSSETTLTRSEVGGACSDAPTPAIPTVGGRHGAVVSSDSQLRIADWKPEIKPKPRGQHRSTSRSGAGATRGTPKSTGNDSRQGFLQKSDAGSLAIRQPQNLSKSQSETYLGKKAWQVASSNAACPGGDSKAVNGVGMQKMTSPPGLSSTIGMVGGHCDKSTPNNLWSFNPSPSQKAPEEWPDLSQASKTQSRGTSRLRNQSSSRQQLIGQQSEPSSWRSSSQPKLQKERGTAGCMPRRDPLAVVWVCQECHSRFSNQEFLMEHQESEGHWGPTLESSCTRTVIRKGDLQGGVTDGTIDRKSVDGDSVCEDTSVGTGSPTVRSSCESFSLITPRGS